MELVSQREVGGARERVGMNKQVISQSQPEMKSCIAVPDVSVYGKSNSTSLCKHSATSRTDSERRRNPEADCRLQLVADLIYFYQNGWRGGRA